jgi:hypothetical protein
MHVEHSRMQTLRHQSDVSRTITPNGSLGCDAARLGRRILAAAESACAMHMAMTTEAGLQRDSRPFERTNAEDPR